MFCFWIFISVVRKSTIAFEASRPPKCGIWKSKIISLYYEPRLYWSFTSSTVSLPSMQKSTLWMSIPNFIIMFLMAVRLNSSSSAMRILPEMLSENEKCCDYNDLILTYSLFSMSSKSSVSKVNKKVVPSFHFEAKSITPLNFSTSIFDITRPSPMPF